MITDGVSIKCKNVMTIFYFSQNFYEKFNPISLHSKNIFYVKLRGYEKSHLVNNMTLFTGRMKKRLDQSY